MKRPDDGATLVELLAAVIIIGMIGAALTESIILGLRATEQTDRRVSESLDRQLVSTYFTRDVHSAQSVNTETCGDATEGETKLSLRWDDGADTTVVSYVFEADQRRLIRRSCLNGAPRDVNSVASHLAGDGAVSLVCPPEPGCPPAKVALRLFDQSGASYLLEAFQRITPPTSAVT